MDYRTPAYQQNYQMSVMPREIYEPMPIVRVPEFYDPMMIERRPIYDRMPVTRPQVYWQQPQTYWQQPQVNWQQPQVNYSWQRPPEPGYAPRPYATPASDWRANGMY